MKKLKINSLSSKIFISFILFGLFLLTILFIQIIPNMQEEQKKHTTKEIENIIYLTTQQLILAEKAIKNNGISKREELKSVIEFEANRIYENIKQDTKINDFKNSYLQFSSKKISCNTTILDKNKEMLFQVEKENFTTVLDNLKIDNFLRYDEENKYVCSMGIRKFFYTKKIKDSNNLLLISCDIDKFLTKSIGLEENIKSNIQTSFSLMSDYHKGKTYLMWMNTQNIKNSSVPLYQKNDDSEYNEKYCLSKLSSFRFPKTGLLTVKEILDAINKEPIKHLLDSPQDKENYIYPTLTWVRLISGNSKEKFLYITSMYEKDFIQNIDSSFLQVLPAAIFSLIIVLIIGLLLFKRLFKSINILANTATQVNKGDMKQRNNIKGTDDIAMLANAFDAMLDSLEKNIAKNGANRTPMLIEFGH